MIAAAIFYWTFGVSVIATVPYDLERCAKANAPPPCTNGGWLETGRYRSKAECERGRKDWNALPAQYVAHECRKEIIGWTD